MTKEEIIEGSKIIANYLNWVYIPFNDLQGLKKAGWYKFAPKSDNEEEVTFTTFTMSGGEKGEEKVETKLMNIDFIRYNPKNGWITTDKGYYQYVCRKHSELRFYNSMDSLLPVIKKLEKEENLTFNLYNNGGSVDEGFTTIAYSFGVNESWIQNVFNVVVGTIKYIKNGE